MTDLLATAHRVEAKRLESEKLIARIEATGAKYVPPPRVYPRLTKRDRNGRNYRPASWEEHA